VKFTPLVTDSAHDDVVWRHFKASKDGKEALKDRGIEPKLRARKKTDDDLRQELAAKRAYIEEPEAARSSATGPAAEPTAVPSAIAEAVTSDIQPARGNFVTLLPTDHDARREELVAIIGAATKRCQTRTRSRRAWPHASPTLARRKTRVRVPSTLVAGVSCVAVGRIRHGDADSDCAQAVHRRSSQKHDA
jgi:hypothetical protein